MGNFYQIPERTIYKILERTIRIKLCVSWSEFARNIGKIQQRTTNLMCFITKVDQIFLKGQYGSTRCQLDFQEMLETIGTIENS